MNDKKSIPSLYETHRDKLINYLLLKAEQSDWHGVSDAANDLRVMEAEHNAKLSIKLFK